MKRRKYSANRKIMKNKKKFKIKIELLRCK